MGRRAGACRALWEPTAWDAAASWRVSPLSKATHARRGSSSTPVGGGGGARIQPPAAAGSIRGSSISAGRAPKNKNKRGNRAAHLDPRAERAAAQQRRNLVSSRRNPFPGPEGQGRRHSCAPVSVDPDRTEVGAGLEKRNPLPPLSPPGRDRRCRRCCYRPPKRGTCWLLTSRGGAVHCKWPTLGPRCSPAGTLRVPLREKTPLPLLRPAQWVERRSSALEKKKNRTQLAPD